MVLLRYLWSLFRSYLLSSRHMKRTLAPYMVIFGNLDGCVRYLLSQTVNWLLETSWKSTTSILSVKSKLVWSSTLQANCTFMDFWITIPFQYSHHWVYNMVTKCFPTHMCFVQRLEITCQEIFLAGKKNVCFHEFFLPPSLFFIFINDHHQYINTFAYVQRVIIKQQNGR